MWNLFRWHSRSYLTYLICKSYELYYLIISTFIYILIFGILLGWSWESWQIIFVSCFLYFTFLCYVTVIWIYLVYTRLKTTCKKHILIKKSHSRNNLNFKKRRRKEIRIVSSYKNLEMSLVLISIGFSFQNKK